MRGLVRLALLACALALVCGCASGERVIELREWTFVGPDGRLGGGSGYPAAARA